MTMTSPHLSCNGGRITTEENENDCTEIESSLKQGWTHTSVEGYCPICADVRSQTWPDTEETDRKAEPSVGELTAGDEHSEKIVTHPLVLDLRIPS